MTAWRMLRVALPTLIVSLLLSVVLSTAHAAVTEPPVLLGIYPNGNLITPGGLDEIIAIDAWIQSEPGLGSKGISIAATFIDPCRLLRSEIWEQPTGLVTVGRSPHRFDVQLVLFK